MFKNERAPREKENKKPSGTAPVAAGFQSSADQKRANT